jgi:DNA (cytosine-5)-methyltransferase 1
MTHGSLFSGIGGFDLAAEWMGWENIFHCEWNSFGQKVLKYHFPNSISYDDITKTDFTIHRGRIDILTGGFPCQPYSMAGKRLGKEDERHLWPEMLRAIREIQPRWVVGENVLGLVNWSGGLVFHEVQADLEAEGYEVQPYVLPACAVNAPHRRDRVWFVAYRNATNPIGIRLQRWEASGHIQGSTGKTQSKGSESSISFEANGSERTTPHTNGNPKGAPRQSTSTTRNRSNINVQQSERGSKTELNNRPFAVSRDVAHPHGNGLNERNGNDEEQPSEGGLDAQCNPLPSNGNGDVTNTESKRLQGCPDSGKVSSAKRKMGRKGNQSTIESAAIVKESNASNTDNERLQKRSITKWNDEKGWQEQSRPIEQSAGNAWEAHSTNWRNFPTTEPTIRTRNDGISSRLDGITFSKWRNESIKAGGNAIVPQVVYQIFKAIEQYEKG